jgi:thymidylate synthase|tara:strand:+ start:5179 stop:6207 length:1029 start_codon:yes stop_codon:yes gene_type:complete
MRVIETRNVNSAILRGIDLFRDTENYIEQDSRNGKTLECVEPVTTVFKKPLERVCLIEERDANPFFHFIESMWMIAGRDDLNTLTYYVSSMSNFSDDGETLWGAYGKRWRKYFLKDQLDVIVKILKYNPDDRRAVLQMWDPIMDLAKNGKDVPCNTNIYFKIRDNKLNMTVCNRSNDMLWGAYGANVVHMSVLQEYIAHKLEIDVGVYRQVSDSFHVYLNDVWDKVKHLTLDVYFKHTNNYDALEDFKPFPLFYDNGVLDWELNRFFHYHPADLITSNNWESPCMRDIAVPMATAYSFYKSRNFYEALQQCERIVPVDWKNACLSWLRTREQRHYEQAEKGE